MPRTLNTALDSLVPSGIRRFSQMAAATPGCISLTLGEPGESTPEAICAEVAPELTRGMTHYPPNDGTDELRGAIAAYMSSNNEHYDPAQIVVTNGATEALFSVLMALVEPGDEIIIPQPAFGLYESIARLARAKVVPLDTAHDDFQLTAEALRAAASPRTKAIMLTTPNNPTGCTLTSESLDTVAEIAREQDFYVVCDDVYEQLVYTDEYQTFAQRHPELAKQTIIVNSFSKPYAMCGWRLGWFAASSEVVAAARKVHQYAVSCLPAFTQHAAAIALSSDVEPMRERYRARRDCVIDRLEKMGLACVEPDGAFYAFPSIERFGMDSEEFCERAIREAGVALVPGVFFGASSNVRLSYSVADDELTCGLDRLEHFVLAQDKSL